MFGLRTHFQLPCGCVDQYEDGVLYGWAWHPSSPSQRVNVDVFYEGRFLGQFFAAYFREDLLSHKIGDGRHAFRAHVGHKIGQSDGGRFEVYTSSPKQVALKDLRSGRVSGRFRSQTISAAVRDVFLPLLTDLQLEFASRGIPDAQQDSGAKEQWRLFDIIFTPHKDRNPTPIYSHTLCEYTDHIRLAHGLGECYDTTFAQSRFDAFLKWYLENYCTRWRDSRAPLSSSEIAYLNQFVSCGGLQMTRAASLFAEDDGMVPPSGIDRSFGEKVIYWWAVERSRELFVEDCLVPQEYIDVLRTTVHDVEFPLSKFMIMFISRNSILRQISIEGAVKRQLVYYIVMLYALQMPHILRFVPPQWLRSMTVSDLGDRSPFEVCHEFIFGGESSFTPAAYAAHLFRSGYSIKESTFTHFARNGNRILSARLGCRRDNQVDVQIIGPLTRTLGLGESSRLLAKSVESLGYRVNYVDFDLENRSPAEQFDVSEALPASINILHLNPEAIPSAIARLPDVFSDAYNIGFCYWELSFPADCQLLGLRILDEVWSASAFVVENLRPYCKIAFNMGMTCEFTSAPPKTRDRKRLEKFAISEGDFVFLTVSDALSRVQRKNPVGAIKAFLEAFPDDQTVRLVVKTHNSSLVIGSDQRTIWNSIKEVAASDSRIIFIDATLSREEHLGLIRASDCLVSLHRAEGFGLDLFYAAGHGVPIMATGYSGNMEFCSNELTWLIGHTELYVGQHEYAFVRPGHKWVDPNLWEAVEAMREIRSNQSERTKRASAAKGFVRRELSLDVFTKRIDVRLKQIMADRKQRVSGLINSA
jgi:glycosyltransferase involved in cell wall biosynthesis